VASLFIACKYEEIYPPDLKDFVYITDNAYTKQEVLDMEGKILQTLQFCITQPSAFCFLQRFARIAGFDRKN
jgi:G2/mitotic-specific cyclin-B, other